MKDRFGNELEIGDEVIFVHGRTGVHYESADCIQKGAIKKLNHGKAKNKVQVAIKKERTSQWEQNNFCTYPSHCIKLDENQRIVHDGN